LPLLGWFYAADRDAGGIEQARIGLAGLHLDLLQPGLRGRGEAQLILILKFVLNVGEKGRERYRVAKTLRVDFAAGRAGDLGQVVLPGIGRCKSAVGAARAPVIDGIDDDLRIADCT
jgi:hypothetical protein